jgi:hypothetical protein
MPRLSEYRCVIITLSGKTNRTLLVPGYGELVTDEIYKVHCFINDPSDVSLCVPALTADAEFIERCENAVFVYAWVPEWVQLGKNLTLYVPPAAPGALS